MSEWSRRAFETVITETPKSRAISFNLTAIDEFTTSQALTGNVHAAREAGCPSAGTRLFLTPKRFDNPLRLTFNRRVVKRSRDFHEALFLSHGRFSDHLDRGIRCPV